MVLRPALGMGRLGGLGASWVRCVLCTLWVVAAGFAVPPAFGVSTVETGTVELLGVSPRSSGPLIVAPDTQASPTVSGLPGLTYVVAHPTLPVFYATKESGSGNRVVVALTHSATGWRELGRATTGTGPVHIALDSAGRTAFVAGYTDGSITRVILDERGVPTAAKRVRLAAGRGPDPKRQRGPHAHSSAVSADDRFVVVADLGTDSLHIFDARTLGLLRTERLPPGTGPRTAVFVDSFTLVVSEELRGGVSWWSFDNGRLTLVRRTALDGTTPSDVIVRPDASAGTGPAVIVISRGTDELIGVSFDGETRRWPTPGCGARHGSWTENGDLVLACTRGGEIRRLRLGSAATAEVRSTTALAAVSGFAEIRPRP